MTKSEHLLRALDRCADGECGGCRNECTGTVRQAAAQIRGQERRIECLMAANEGHRRMLVELHQRLAKAELGWISTEEAQPVRSGDYWVRTAGGIYTVLPYSARHGAWNAMDEQETTLRAIPVTHWMEILPAVEGDRP